MISLLNFFLLLTIISTLIYHVESIDEYINAFLKLHGSNDSIDVEKLDSFITSLKYINKEMIRKNVWKNREVNASCHTCSAKCLSAKEIFEQFNFNPKESIDANRTKQISTAILFRIQNINCYSKDNKAPVYKKPTVAETWGYGFLFVTLINLCSLTGVLFIPIMKLKIFKFLLIFMVALAVGTLLGMALLFLIPETLQLADIVDEVPQFDGYLYKSTAIACGIYMFFLFERALKSLVGLKHSNLLSTHGHSHMHLNVDKTQIGLHAHGLDLEDNFSIDSVESNQDYSKNVDSSKGLAEEDVKLNDNNFIGSIASSFNKKNKKSVVAPVAWMVITGDSIHNCIDGLSIGASFAISILSGVVISISMICEMLPHKLGDIALLLNAGMTVKQAVSWSLLSSCSCYVGLAIGILLGELTNAAIWVFSLSAGMFLYISLVDMLPEMNHAIESEESLKLGRAKIFFLQNIGLIAGFSILLILALYGGNFSF